MIQRARALMLEPSHSLSQRVVRGGFWVFALRIVSRGLSLVRTMVLARVLAPDDFGLMGIAMLAMSTLETFSQTGFQAALIQKQEDIEDHLDTAWTISTLRGVALFAFLYLAAPSIARFFNTPAATPIVRVISISELLKGLTNVGVVYFRKELEFNKQFIYHLSGTVADLVVAVTAALLLRSVWALILGLLAKHFVQLVVSYVVQSYRPRIRVDLARARDLYGFGKFVFARSILLFILTQGDDAFVGKILGTTALGFYQLAYTLSNMPATEITHVISQVTFPAYSRLQDDRERLERALTRTLGFTTIISIPLASGTLALTPEFVKVFLGDRWLPMVPAMQVLCLFGAMRSISAAFGPVYQAVARLDIPLKINVLQIVLLAATIYPLSSRWGILGTALCVTLMLATSLYLFAKGVATLLNGGVMSLLKPALLSIAASGGMVVVVFLLKRYVLHVPSYGSVLALVVSGGASYFGLLFLVYRAAGQGLGDILQELAALLRYR